MRSNDSGEENICAAIKMKQPVSLYAKNEEVVDEKECVIVDLSIDHYGQVLYPHKIVSHSVKCDNPITNLMSMLQTSRSILTKFGQLNMQPSDLVELNDLDLQYLGIESEFTRKQMLKELAVLHKHTNISNPDGTALLLNNLFQHITNLKFCLGPMLIRLYDQFEKDVLINDRLYECQRVQQTIHEIDCAANGLERQLYNLQFNRNCSKHSGCSCLWPLLAVGVTSVFGFVYLSKFVGQYSQKFLASRIVPSYPRW